MVFSANMRHKVPVLLAAALIAGCSGPRPAFDPRAEEGPHGGAGVEWWYHYGWLEDEDGRRWAWVSSFFRTVRPRTGLSRYLIHDLIDLETGRGRFRSRVGAEIFAALSIPVPKLKPPHELIPGRPLEKPDAPLDLRYGRDRLERTGPDTYRLVAGDVDLELTAVAEPVAVEGTGLTGIDRPEGMHYYSVPRLNATGTVHGRRAKGVFWYDHQWGDSWVDGRVGWSWWGLQFDDGGSAIAYVLRDRESGRVIRSVLTDDRGVHRLSANPVETWTSPLGARYPVAWELSGGGHRLKVTPMFRERECPILGEQVAVWEGPVRVTGSRRGRGFQELVGYARN